MAWVPAVRVWRPCVAGCLPAGLLPGRSEVVRATGQISRHRFHRFWLHPAVEDEPAMGREPSFLRIGRTGGSAEGASSSAHIR